jgi:hypothetical protein
MSWSLKFDETIALIKGKALMGSLRRRSGDNGWSPATRLAEMNRIGRLAIFAVLLIVALLIIWQVFGAAWGQALRVPFWAAG